MHQPHRLPGLVVWPLAFRYLVVLPLAVPVVAVLGLAGFAAGQEPQPKLPEEIILKLRGTDGKPVADETISVIFEIKDKHHFELVDTDGEGRLELITPEAFRGAKAGSLRLQRAAWSNDDESVPVRYLGARKITFADVVKIKPAAFVQLQKTGLAVSGQVVDRQGKPLAGVRVSIGANVSGSLSNYRNVRDRTMYDMAVCTDADGRFAIHELGEGRGRIGLQIKSDTHVQVSRPNLAVGASKVKIVMGLASDVFAKVSGVPTGQRLSLFVRLAPREPIPGRAYFEADRNQRNGEIQIRGCIAGTYDFHVMEGFGMGAKPILTIENVKVEAGKDCRDPRLAALDISAHYRWIQVQVVNPAGELMARSRIAVSTRSGSGRSTRYYYGRAAAAWLMIPTDGVDLQISADGFRTKTVTKARVKKALIEQAPNAKAPNVKGQKSQKGLRVVLSPSWQIELKISNLPDLAASQVKIQLQEREYDPRLPGRRGRGLSSTPVLHKTFDAADQAESMPINSAGTHLLRILAVVPARGRTPAERFARASMPRDEHIVLGSRKVVVRESQKTGEPIRVDIKLSATERAALKSFDSVLKERKR